jgi:hypothetical protein
LSDGSQVDLVDVYFANEDTIDLSPLDQMAQPSAQPAITPAQVAQLVAEENAATDDAMVAAGQPQHDLFQPEEDMADLGLVQNDPLWLA